MITKKELITLLQERTKEAYEFAQEIDPNAPGGETLKAKYAAIFSELWSICDDADIRVDF